MYILEKHYCDVSIHGDAAGPIGVPDIIIPSEVDSCKFCSSPVCGDLLFLFESLEEMEAVLFSHVFDAEVVNDLKKLNGAPLMAPETRCCGGLVIPSLLKMGAQEVIGESA